MKKRISLSFVVCATFLASGCSSVSLKTGNSNSSSNSDASINNGVSNGTSGSLGSSSGTKSTNTSNEAVKRHNEIRAEVFSGSKMTWNDSLALSAQSHADKLAKENAFYHSNSNYGENLYAHSSKGVSYVKAIDSWYSEKADYNTKTKTCNTGKTCGHYTQMIWENSTELGCGTSSSATWGTIVVCQYNPPGNYTGQKPY